MTWQIASRQVEQAPVGGILEWEPRTELEVKFWSIKGPYGSFTNLENVYGEFQRGQTLQTRKGYKPAAI